MKVIAIFALILISTTLGAVITTKQLECIAACKVTMFADCAKVSEIANCLADSVKEASIIAAGTCVYGTLVDDVSVYCTFGTCYKKAYTVKATSNKNGLACENTCLGGCASSA